MRRDDDHALSTIIGAILVFAAVGVALISINAFQVPEQGTQLELRAAERLDASLTALVSRLSLSPVGPVLHDVPLRPDPAPPPLLSGVVLTPVRAQGSLSLEDGSRIRISTLVAGPPGGVPADDPTRRPEGNGNMRVYLVGTSEAMQPLGALRVTSGGAYAAESVRYVEGGASLSDLPHTSAVHARPALLVAGDTLTWRLPLLAGGHAAASGGSTTQLLLVPGPEALHGGGGPVKDIKIRIETDRLAAWRSLLEDAVGPHGTVTVTSTGADAGAVEAILVDKTLQLYVVRYEARPT